MTTLGLYHPGHSLLHRLPVGWKLLVMGVAVIATTLIRQPWQVGVAAAPVLLAYLLARIPARVALAQLRPLLPFLPFIGAFQLIFGSWQQAVISAGVLILAVGLAALVTLTTPVTAILDLCRRSLRPFRRFGVDPDRVGLLLALTIRCLPVAAGIVTDVWQARKARGVSGVRNAAIALAAPTVVRALRTADALGDALRARGVDD